MSGESDEIEDAAIELVARAIAGVSLQKAMAAAIARHAGNALSRLADHEEAAHLHTKCARKHFARMAEDKGRGRPRR